MDRRPRRGAAAARSARTFARRAVRDAEALHDRGGTARHAVKAARDPRARVALREAVRRLDSTLRRSGRRDADAAAASWPALVAGRWSIADHFDRGGRRFLIARRSDPALVRPARLTPRERQVVGHAALGHSNKLIGYELGLSPSTVVAHLAHAADRLGGLSRAELVQLCAGLGAAASSRRRQLVARTLRVGDDLYRVIGIPMALPPSLSPAEQDIARRVFSGGSNRVIARGRGTSPRTVANQLASI